MAGQAAERFLPNHADWGGEATPLDGIIGSEFVERDFGELSTSEKRLGEVR